MKKILNAILFTVNDYRSVIPRLIVGLIFLSEGIQKFLFPETVGAGRFGKIGFQNPDFTAAFVAVFEISCGILIVAGFLTRLAAIPLFIVMITAISTTKIPIFHEKGFWAMAHEARTDFAMTMLLIHLFIFGAGRPSLDRMVLDGLDGL
ncbi:MAG TPA: DoxX family protein [Bacteroidales bacterium]|nr:DoxX family protein [Bacteroidales bacterium]